MGEALKEFFVSLGLDADAASWASATAMVDGLETVLQRLVGWVDQAASSLANSVIETGRYGSELDDVSKKTGFATQAIEEYTYASKLVGGSSETLTQAATHLARKMSEVQNGSKEAASAFARLGVRVFDSNGKLRNLDDVMNDVADGLAKTTPGAERMGAAFGVMGKGGADAIPLLGEGSAELKRLREEFRLTVGTLTNEQVAMLDKFDDSLVTLRSVGSAVTREFVMPIISALQPVIDRTLEWVRANRQLITSTVTRWGQNLVDVFTAGARAAQLVAVNVTRLVAVVKLATVTFIAFRVATLAMAAATAIANVGLGQLLVNFTLNSAAAVAYAGVSVWAAVRTAAAWLAAAAPVIALTAALVLAALAAEDVYVFLQGGHSVIGELGPKWTKFIDAFTRANPEDPWWLQDLKTALAIVTDLQGFFADPTGVLRRSRPQGRAAGGAVDVQQQLEWVRQNPNFEPTPEERAKGMLGSKEITERIFQPPVIGPFAAQSAARGALTVNPVVNVTVNATPNQSPVEVGQEAARAAEEVLKRELRKLK